jgi:hypothetical protein
VHEVNTPPSSWHWRVPSLTEKLKLPVVDGVKLAGWLVMLTTGGAESYVIFTGFEALGETPSVAATQ